MASLLSVGINGPKYDLPGCLWSKRQSVTRHVHHGSIARSPHASPNACTGVALRHLVGACCDAVTGLAVVGLQPYSLYN